MQNHLRHLTDLAMAAILPVLMAYSLAGEALHEWLGLAMLVLFLLHHSLNHRWWTSLNRGKYSPFRVLSMGLDLLLTAVMILLPISGLVMAQYIPRADLPFRYTALARKVHLLTAYWGFLIMGLHLGLHWNMVVSTLKKRAGKRSMTVLRVLGILITIYGAYAFFERGLVNYLFLKTHFVFFDFGESLAGFLMDHLAIMALFVWLGHYLSRFLRSLRTK